MQFFLNLYISLHRKKKHVLRKSLMGKKRKKHFNNRQIDGMKRKGFTSPLPAPANHQLSPQTKLKLQV